jgi:hypothetical protein
VEARIAEPAAWDDEVDDRDNDPDDWDDDAAD